MRDRDRSVTNFHVAYPKLFTNIYIILKLISHQESFKQSTTKINGNAINPRQPKKCWSARPIPETRARLSTTARKISLITVPPR